jgi:hypothetical protein
MIISEYDIIDQNELKYLPLPFKKPKKGLHLEEWKEAINKGTPLRELNLRRVRQSLQYEDLMPESIRGEIWINFTCGKKENLNKIRNTIKYEELKIKSNPTIEYIIKKDMTRTLLGN